MTPVWAYAYHMLHEVCYYNGYPLEHLETIVRNEYPKEAMMQLEIGCRLRVEHVTSEYEDEYWIHDIQEGKSYNINKLVPWMERSIALLLLIEPGQQIENVGYRYNSSVFYLDRRGLI